jgi:hypothetical protein
VRPAAAVLIAGRAVLPDEQYLEQTLRLPQTSFGQCDGFRLADRAADKPLLVESCHRIPIEALPSSIAVVPAEVQERKHHFVNSLGINHDPAGLLRNAAAGSRDVSKISARVRFNAEL